ncbi:LysR substrate-binding domain-containing protein [Nocardia sp. NPDC127579]|uniref:LysR substrate-binding domain-containing protein n=1 Tax=Nocardia sp. NPDC127579 TaxID=3345402 RepID=UPI003632E792
MTSDGTAQLTVGILSDSTDPGVTRLAAEYRRRHPEIEIRVRATDLTDPTCGLRAGLVDVAVTRELPNLLIRSFVRTAVAAYRNPPPRP